MRTILILLIFFKLFFADYCGTDQVAIGMEVHISGVARLLCGKPNCFDKNYSECPERAESRKGCKKENEWIGGFDATIDGKLYTMCCEFENLKDFVKPKYKEVRIRRGEYFEGEEKQNDDGDVTSFDVIKDIQTYRDDSGNPYYNLTVYNFNCVPLAEQTPKWVLKTHWPYFKK
ncbi:unnamed protein product [Caenorhabditis angaria]|uniref:Uncharacterized protein n=1 Tax=Caenorhabditis angaria TaxID=860376 RepID=A0A9P1IQ97_9PELO|nr:unnamed protein product [Caenorhabditis angaria]